MNKIPSLEVPAEKPRSPAELKQAMQNAKNVEDLKPIAREIQSLSGTDKVEARDHLHAFIEARTELKNELMQQEKGFDARLAGLEAKEKRAEAMLDLLSPPKSADTLNAVSAQAESWLKKGTLFIDPLIKGSMGKLGVAGKFLASGWETVKSWISMDNIKNIWNEFAVSQRETWSKMLFVGKYLGGMVNKAQFSLDLRTIQTALEGSTIQLSTIAYAQWMLFNNTLKLATQDPEARRAAITDIVTKIRLAYERAGKTVLTFADLADPEAAKQAARMEQTPVPVAAESPLESNKPQTLVVNEKDKKNIEIKKADEASSATLTVDANKYSLEMSKDTKAVTYGVIVRPKERDIVLNSTQGRATVTFDALYKTMTDASASKEMTVNGFNIGIKKID